MKYNIEKYLKKYYKMKVKKIIKSKSPNFVKIKRLEELRTKFGDDLIAKIRFTPEEYKEIVENIDYHIKKQKSLSLFGKITMRKLLLTKVK